MESPPTIDWQRLDALIRRDPSARGLATYRDGDGALLPNDLAAAALDLAERAVKVLIVTGFSIVTADGVRAETDGPPGAVFLAGMLRACDIEVDIATDALNAPLVRVGLHAAALHDVGLIEADASFSLDTCEAILGDGYSHLVAIERVGPNHTLESIVLQDEAQQAEFAELVASADRDTCRNMRGEAIDAHTPPLHLLFECECECDADEIDADDSDDFDVEEQDDEVDLDDDNVDASAEDDADDGDATDEESLDDEADEEFTSDVVVWRPTSIGIADGGNEIGCGNIPWSTLRRAVARGPAALTACRIVTDYLIVAGISNWGAYGLGAALAAVADRQDTLAAWTRERQAAVIRAMVDEAGAVDGMTKRSEPTVDGVALEPYLDTFDEIRKSCLAP